MLKLYVCFFTLFFMGKIFANNLTLSITESLPEYIEDNIKAYLGELPKNELSRVSFIHSAKSNTIKALKALGYYQSIVETTLHKNEGNDGDR